VREYVSVRLEAISPYKCLDEGLWSGGRTTSQMGESFFNMILPLRRLPVIGGIMWLCHRLQERVEEDRHQLKLWRRRKDVMQFLTPHYYDKLVREVLNPADNGKMKVLDQHWTSNTPLHIVAAVLDQRGNSATTWVVSVKRIVSQQTNASGEMSERLTVEAECEEMAGKQRRCRYVPLSVRFDRRIVHCLYSFDQLTSYLDTSKRMGYPVHIW
jgi:hypothetical protein